MFLKDKHSGIIEFRGYCGGGKQRDYMTKGETRPAKVTQEVLMMLCIIDSMENHEVVTTNITGTFLHTDMEGMVQVQLDGILTEILLKTGP